MTKSVAIFDSGVGGFTVLLDAVQVFSDEDFLYYADTANVPYGEKTAEEVRKLVEASVKKIKEHEVKAIVLACNTATSAAANMLREHSDIPIIGMEPAIKPALAATSKKVLLLSTELTARGKKLKELLNEVDKDNRVEILALPELVMLAEKMDWTSEKAEKYLNDTVLARDLSKYGAIVLGCTHFIWYKGLLSKILPENIQIFDGNAGTLERLRKILEDTKMLEPAGRDDREIKLIFTGKEDKKRAEAFAKLI